MTELSMWRINAVIGDHIRLLYCVAWSEGDAHHKIGGRMRSEHVPLYTLHTLDRIAQMIITPYLVPQIIEVTELPDSDRGTNGFGSTGN